MDRTEKLNRLLKALEVFAKADDQELIDSLPEEYELLAPILEYTNKFEKVIAKSFKKDIKRAINTLSSREILKAKKTPDLSIDELMALILSDNSGIYEEDIRKEGEKLLSAATTKFAQLSMNIIDKDIAFSSLSPNAVGTTFLHAIKVAKLIKLSSRNTFADILAEGVRDGKSIQDIEIALSDSYGFSRNRARTIAITEVLTASSMGLNEAYIQSPSVEGKKWKHSGSRKNTPRPNHVAASGQVVALDKEFDLGTVSAKYPRDMKLPASERVRCHCVMGPAVNEEIFGLSKAEKEEIRNAVLEGREPNIKKLPPKIKKVVNTKVSQVKSLNELSTKELEKLFIDDFGIKVKSKDPIEQEKLIGIYKAVEEVKGIFPEVVEYLKGIYTNDSDPQGGNSSSRSMAYVYRAGRYLDYDNRQPYTFLADFIVLSKDYLKYSKDEISLLERSCNAGGWHVKTTFYQKIITHESGHVMANLLGNKFGAYPDELEKAIYKVVSAKLGTLRPRKDARKKQAELLSEYGASNNAEVLAEAFAEYVVNGGDIDKTRDYAYAYGKIIRYLLDYKLPTPKADFKGAKVNAKELAEIINNIPTSVYLKPKK